MSRVFAVVEGRSEQAFVNRVLAPHLGSLGIGLEAPLIGPLGHKGGTSRAWQQVSEHLVDLLRSGSGKRTVHVTTMFDFYGMPADWPGRADASKSPPETRAAAVETAIHRSVIAELGTSFAPHLFFPYVQMHELEALLFSDAKKLGYEFLGREGQIDLLLKSVAGMAPEQINDTQAGAPSKRIIGHLPEYAAAKVQVVPQVLDLIGLPAIRRACPHFAAWLTKLESLAPRTSTC